MKRSSLVIALALLTAAAGAGGCSSKDHESPSGKPASSSPTTPDQTMVTWVGKVCAVDALIQRLSRTEVPIYSDPPRSQVRALVKNISQQLRLGVTSLEAIGHAPVAGGDEVVAAYIRGLKSKMPDVAEVKSYVDGDTPMIVGGTNLPMLTLGTALMILAPDGPDLPSLLDRNAALTQAYRTAPACQGFLPLRAHTPSPEPSR